VVNPKGHYPQPKSLANGKELTLPEFYEQVFALDQIIDVDYYLPGCPPPPDLIMNAVNAVLEDKLPPKGSALAPRKALCDSCKRNRTKPSKLIIRDIKRIHEVEASSETCFLTQNIICMGPATRAGCGESCININMPCRGCFGPVEGVKDAGAKYIAALASMLDAEDDKAMRALIDKIDDLPGYLYRFSLPSSTLIKKRS
jgi:F420-non-reducing hydrogenase small subunit